MNTLDSNGINANILLDRIQALRADWDLSDGEDAQLDHFEHRVMQQHPSGDVTTMDMHRINQEFHGAGGFKIATLIDLLFNA